MYKVIVKNGAVYVKDPLLIRYYMKDHTVLIQTETETDEYETDAYFDVLPEGQW